MKTILKSDDFEELIKISQYPDNFSGEESLIELSHTLNYNGIKSKGHHILLNGIHIDYSTLYLPRDCSVLVEKDQYHLEMHFELTGNTFYSSDTKETTNFDISAGEGTFFFLPELKGCLNFPRSENRTSIEIELTIEYLKEVFNDDLNALGEFGEDILKGIPSIMGGGSYAITRPIKQVLHDIVNCPYTDILKKVYLESKIIELLTLKIAQYNESTINPKENKKTVRKEDIEKLYFVKELIIKNIQEPCSLIQLSEQAGLNDYKLKKGFKELFGTTVFGYLADLRMEQAQKHIKEGLLSIGQVSEIIGYKNQQHFTAAFKKKYGYLPKDLKNKNI